MPVLYKPFQSVLEDKKTQKKLFYPRVVHTGNVTSDKLSKEIAAYSSLSPGDVKNALDNLVTVMTQHLQNSETVSVDGLGTFRMIMRSQGKGVSTADEVSASQATLTIRFQPATTKNQDRTVATRSMVSGTRCIRFDKLSLGIIGNGGATPQPGKEEEEENKDEHKPGEEEHKPSGENSGSSEETPDPIA